MEDTSFAWDRPRHPDHSYCIYNDNFFDTWPSKKSEKDREINKGHTKEYDYIQNLRNRQ